MDREDELELLKRTFSRAAREQTAKLVTLLGEPGGKSRLVLEFYSYLDDLPGDHDLAPGSLPPLRGGHHVLGLGEIVKAQAGILGSDGTREAAEKLTEAVSAAIEDPAEQGWIQARLAPLIGLTDVKPERIEREEAFSAWRRFLEALGSARPLVLVFEDVHWADPALLAFIEHLVEWSSGVPMLVICTARPELFDREPDWGGGMRNWSTISLAPLEDADTERMIADLLPDEESGSLAS